jgi:hypothetical protein
MNLALTGAITQVDKDTADFTVSGTLSDPVFPAPPSLSASLPASDFGLTLGQTYTLFLSTNVEVNTVLVGINGLGILTTPVPGTSPAGFWPWSNIVRIEPIG